MGLPMPTAFVASGRLVGQVRKLRNSSAGFHSKMGMGVMPTTFRSSYHPLDKTHFLHPDQIRGHPINIRGRRYRGLPGIATSGEHHGKSRTRH